MQRLSETDAASEIMARRVARNSLLSFTEYTLPSFESGEHHKKIADALEKVERGEIKRLMIFAPPRHTKSELASRRFPAWYLGKNPNRQIICTTYSHEFAADFGRDVRNIVASDEYKNLFETTLREDSKSANRWHTTQNGVYVSTGIGGALTGRGGNIILIDDPLKNRDEADSELIREKIWKWYTSTLYTRLMPGGSIILVLTRWHEDDLAGRLLEQEKQGGDKWEVINLRAIENEGTRNEKALWPQWYDLNALHAIKKAIGHRDWISLYQQEPKPIEGTLIKREWFKRHYHDETPKRLNAYITTDFATDPNGGDFTEFGVWGIDEDFNVWALDWWYDQESPDVWIEKLLDLADEHKPLCVFGESGVIRRSIDPFLSKRMQKRRVFFRKEWITRTHNKVTSLRGFQGLAASGKINIPLCDWGDRLINQLCEFPAAKYDDAVDVCSLLGMALDDQHEAIAPAGPTQPKRDSWGRAKRRADSWRV